MIPEENIEKNLEQLADHIGRRELFVNDVMARIKDSSVQHSKTTNRNIVLRSIFMKRTVKFAAAAIIVIAAFLSLTIWDTMVPNVKASEVFTSAIAAVQNVHSIYIKARLRTLPADNFSYINLDLDFVPIEMWKKQCDDGQLRMRIDKPQRQIAFDNKMATMLVNNTDVVQCNHRKTYGAYDSGWLSHMLKVEKLLQSELQVAQDDPKNEIQVYHEDVNGTNRLVVKRLSKSNVSENDYLRNHFVDDSDRMYVYYFDPQTKLLEALQIFVTKNAQDVLLFDITDIAYNIELADDLFTLDIPADAVRHKDPEILPDNEKYASMTPKEAATAFFTACAQENWDEVLKFETGSRIDENLQKYLGGIEIISIGEPFQSESYGGWFVPYEIKLKDGYIKKHNLALRNDNKAKRWIEDGGI